MMESKATFERDERGGSSGAAHCSAALTFAALAALAASMPKAPMWRYCTLTPENFERLRHDTEFRSDKMPACGIEIHVKHGQVADSWMFSDSRTLRKYLAGELSELDLIGLIDTGACQPNDQAHAPRI